MLGDALVVMGRPSKLGPKQWFLCLILFIKHNKVIIYDAFMWSWAKSSLSDDVLFVVSCINHALVDEIHWLSFFERVALGNQLCELLRCLRFIDMTLVEIQSHGRIQNMTWFNDHKEIYAMNNTMVLEHHGLFICIELAYHGFYHDVNSIHHSAIYHEWHQYFIHHNEYHLEDPKYLGEEMFIMKRMGKQELPPNVNHGVI
jgi:hypothetical protein